LSWRNDDSVKIGVPAKGNVVFDAGSIWWAQGLSSPPGHVLPANNAAKPQGPDKRVQRIMKNVFDRFI